MQLTETEPASEADRRPRVLGPSLALDLDWAVHAASKPELRDAHPALSAAYSADPGLARRIGGLWDDDLRCLPELDLLAHHAGALEVTELPALQEAVESHLATVPDALPLRSETPEDRAAILDRIRALRTGTSRRRRYFELLGELWTGIEPWWRAEGVPGVERAGALLRQELARGVDWRQLVRSECHMLQDHLPSIAERQAGGDVELLLAPCALFGKGLYLDLPGSVIVGFGVTRADLTARARTEQMARRLRAVADPTRLAILDHLANGASSVTEIARTFSLSQPTVSSHMRQLREAGLVRAERHGVRLEVAVDRDAVASLGSEIAELISR